MMLRLNLILSSMTFIIIIIFFFIYYLLSRLMPINYAYNGGFYKFLLTDTTLCDKVCQ